MCDPQRSITHGILNKIRRAVRVPVVNHVVENDDSNHHVTVEPMPATELPAPSRPAELNLPNEQLHKVKMTDSLNSLTNKCDDAENSVVLTNGSDKVGEMIDPSSKQPSSVSKQQRKKRSYSPTAMTKAYEAVTNDQMPVYRAARQFGVPLSTLRNRTEDKMVPCGVARSGPGQILPQSEEARLVQHLTRSTAVGCNYSRVEVLDMATDLATHSGKRSKNDKRLSMQWFYSFVARWPELQAGNLFLMSKQKINAMWEESVMSYFTELDCIMNRHCVKGKPELVYNIDMTSINHTSAHAGAHTVTVIGCGNAAGSHLPPFLVFQGEQMNSEWIENQSVKVGGTVTLSGCSNYDVMRKYIMEHFATTVHNRDNSETILILYNGHTTHVSLDLLAWANDNNIVLFVSPPQFSHIRQADKFGCVAKFLLTYNEEYSLYDKQGKPISCNDVCSMACKAYTSTLSPSNLKSKFQKVGVFPLKTGAQMIEDLRMNIIPSKISLSYTHLSNEHTNQLSSYTHLSNEQNNQLSTMHVDESSGDDMEKDFEFFGDCDRLCKEINVADDLDEDIESHKRRKIESLTKSNACPTTVMPGNEPVVPHVDNKPAEDEDEEEEEEEEAEAEELDESQIPDDEKCCVCKMYYAHSDKVHKVAITNWAECDVCGHWVHLTYCTNVHVVRKNTRFRCPCCPEK